MTLRLPKADFIRSFAIGFVVGGVLLWTQLGGEEDRIVPSAVAAPAETAAETSE